MTRCLNTIMWLPVFLCLLEPVLGQAPKISIVKLQGFKGFIYIATTTDVQLDQLSKVGYASGTPLYITESSDGNRHSLSCDVGLARLEFHSVGDELGDWCLVSFGSKTMRACEILDIDGDGYLDCRRLDDIHAQIRVGKSFIGIINKRELPMSSALATDLVGLKTGRDVSYVFAGGQWRAAKAGQLPADVDLPKVARIKLRTVSSDQQVAFPRTLAWKQCSAERDMQVSEYACGVEAQAGSSRTVLTTQLGHQVSFQLNELGRVTHLSIDQALVGSWIFSPTGKLQTASLTVGDNRYIDTDGNGAIDEVQQVSDNTREKLESTQLSPIP